MKIGFKKCFLFSAILFIFIGCTNPIHNKNNLNQSEDVTIYLAKESAPRTISPLGTINFSECGDWKIVFTNSDSSFESITKTIEKGKTSGTFSIPSGTYKITAESTLTDEKLGTFTLYGETSSITTGNNVTIYVGLKKVSTGSFDFSVDASKFTASDLSFSAYLTSKKDSSIIYASDSEKETYKLTCTYDSEAKTCSIKSPETGIASGYYSLTITFTVTEDEKSATWKVNTDNLVEIADGKTSTGSATIADDVSTTRIFYANDEDDSNEYTGYLPEFKANLKKIIEILKNSTDWIDAEVYYDDVPAFTDGDETTFADLAGKNNIYLCSGSPAQRRMYYMVENGTIKALTSDYDTYAVYASTMYAFYGPETTKYSNKNVYYTDADTSGKLPFKNEELLFVAEMWKGSSNSDGTIKADSYKWYFNNKELSSTDESLTVNPYTSNTKEKDSLNINFDGKNIVQCVMTSNNQIYSATYWFEFVIENDFVYKNYDCKETTTVSEIYRNAGTETIEITDSTSPDSVFSVPGDGYIYVGDSSGNYVNIYKTTFAGTESIENNIYTEIQGAKFSSIYDIKYDSKSNKLYGIGTDADGNNILFAIGYGDSDKLYTVTLTGLNSTLSETPKCFAVYNGNILLATSRTKIITQDSKTMNVIDGTLSLYSLYWNGEDTTDLELSEETNLEAQSVCTTNNVVDASFSLIGSDISYHPYRTDGSGTTYTASSFMRFSDICAVPDSSDAVDADFYILFSESCPSDMDVYEYAISYCLSYYDDYNNNEINSRGGMIKYSLASSGNDSAVFDLDTSFGTTGIFGYSTTSTTSNAYNAEHEDAKPVIGYFPQEKDSFAGFYGPSKFISIDSQKLLIADDGLYFEAGSNKLLNKDRIIEFKSNTNEAKILNEGIEISFINSYSCTSFGYDEE